MVRARVSTLMNFSVSIKETEFGGRHSNSLLVNNSVSWI
jgi:hypothetical protein